MKKKATRDLCARPFKAFARCARRAEADSMDSDFSNVIALLAALRPCSNCIPSDDEHHHEWTRNKENLAPISTGST
jgi:hypothetical protein